jgi:hypothetical protein
MVSTALTKSATVVLIAALSLSAPSRAETFTRCIASEGLLCYFPGPTIPEDQSGWTDDGINEGKTLPSIEKEDKIDIIYKDASGMCSMEADRLEFLILPSGDAFLVVTTDTRAAVVEHYFFKLDNSGGGTVVWAPLARASDSSRSVR